MVIMKNKDSYLQRKAKQLHQWERVMDNLITRANNTEDKDRSEILNQIDNIKVKKKYIENELKRLKLSDENEWKEERNELEKSWKELRDAFSNSAVRS